MNYNEEKIVNLLQNLERAKRRVLELKDKNYNRLLIISEYFKTDKNTASRSIRKKLVESRCQ